MYAALGRERKVGQVGSVSVRVSASSVIRYDRKKARKKEGLKEGGLVWLNR